MWYRLAIPKNHTIDINESEKGESNKWTFSIKEVYINIKMAHCTFQ